MCIPTFVDFFLFNLFFFFVSFVFFFLLFFSRCSQGPYCIFFLSSSSARFPTPSSLDSFLFFFSSGFFLWSTAPFVKRYPLTPTTLSLSSNHVFFLAGRWSTSGWGGNAHFFTYTRIRSRETGENRKTNEQTKLGVTKGRGRCCNTICMCRLSLAWVTSENSTMLLESDILRLFFTGPYLVSSPLCSVSGVDCPSVDPRQLPLLVLASLYWVASSTLIRLPVPLPGTARFHVQESFVWFRAKTDNWIVCFGSLPP